MNDNKVQNNKLKLTKMQEIKLTLDKLKW